VLGKEEEEDEEDEEEVVSHDASDIMEGRIRSVFGRRESWLGLEADMIQGTEAPSKLGNRDRAGVRCWDQDEVCCC
jgi:hypothetical protein